jgi:hypothetical protein
MRGIAIGCIRGWPQSKAVGVCDEGLSLGERPGYLDTCLLPPLYNARRVNCDLNAYPRILAMAARYASLDAFKQAAPQMQPDAQSSRPAPPGSGDLAGYYWRSFTIDHAAVMTLSDRVASVGNRPNRG